MSIAPVSSFPPERTEQIVKPAPPEGASSGTAENTAPPPVSVSPPKQKISNTNSAPGSYELQQDVVELHQDPEIKDQLIVEYLDKAKNVILQVPSAQELGVERGIAQEIQQAAKLRASAETAAAEGEKSSGH
jgi:hypothetical protein